MKKILYITYDGLTDPLGQSQILPYICGLSEKGYQFTILSFEKKKPYEANKLMIEEIVKKYSIQWVPLSFTSSPPLLSKLYDAIRMRRTAQQLHKRKKFDMVHCRSYPGAEIGLLLKRKTGVPFLFDMRGFWADEKRDGGAWPDSHPILNRVYRYYKNKEKAFVSEADHIISLTNNGKAELQTWPAYNPAIPVSVIPCCADTTLFSVKRKEDRTLARQGLGLSADKLVVSYLGSVGSWYMLDDMLTLFKYIRKSYPGSVFLFITHSDPVYIYQQAKKAGIEKDDLLIRKAGRKEVPGLAKASDINISFIKPVYSKKSSSPTKLGEILCMGIPTIVNAGVGDVDAIVRQVGGGIILPDMSEDSFEKAVTAIPALLQTDPASVRNKAMEIYDLDRGVELYAQVYKRITEK
ncbi:MAG: glycosyltransferase family 4 protein [Chitinophagaceae bacterium]|nr:glycosyltransferase family 4 protein [Chitinophagaceae bacterium]